jgi:tetraacyldisaccharide 4'-kinase
MFLKILRYLLFPLAILYDFITKIRNLLYNNKLFVSITPPIFSICIGNLTVGGTGKTPHLEYLIRLLTKSINYVAVTPKQIVTLSRGYGRKTKGFLIANPQSHTTEIGDEPMQFFIKFGEKVTVTVGEKRVQAIEKIMAQLPNTKIILFDDAFQHRQVKAHVNILLTDYHRLFYQDFLLPTGNLRESRQGAKRATLIIVTKCPQHIDDKEKEQIKQEIRRYTHPQTPILFSHIRYLPVVPLYNHLLGGSKPPNRLPKYGNNRESQNIILVTGLANNSYLENYLSEKYQILTTLAFADHHDYTKKDIAQIVATYQKYENFSPIIITTEKDMVKLRNPTFEFLLQNLPFYYLPIEVYCSAEDEKILKSLINQKPT